MVEDEPAVRILLNRYLTRVGFEADCADSAESALDLVRTGRGYSAYIVDLTLPGMSGVELARVLLEQDGTANIVLMSGYPFEAEKFAKPVIFLRKPFLPKELAAALGQFTDERRQAP